MGAEIMTSWLEMVDGPWVQHSGGRRRNQATSQSKLDTVRVSSLSRFR